MRESRFKETQMSKSLKAPHTHTHTRRLIGGHQNNQGLFSFIIWSEMQLQVFWSESSQNKVFVKATFGPEDDAEKKYQSQYTQIWSVVLLRYLVLGKIIYNDVDHTSIDIHIQRWVNQSKHVYDPQQPQLISRWWINVGILNWVTGVWNSPPIGALRLRFHCRNFLQGRGNFWRSSSAFPPQGPGSKINFQGRFPTQSSAQRVERNTALNISNCSILAKPSLFFG